MTQLERFRALFKGRETHYGQFTSRIGQTPEKIVTTEKGATPLEAWERHLAGVSPGLGISPHTAHNLCYFGVLDVDDNEIDHVALAKKVVEFHLPLIVCRSRSGGAHLYCFFSEPVACSVAVSKLESWTRALGHATNVDGRKVETFPRKAVAATDAGTPWINLPYFGTESGRHAIAASGEILDLDGFLTVAEALRLNETELEATRARTGNEFEEDGPPCLATILANGGTVEGARNNHLTALATYFKAKYPEEWADKLREHNNKHVHKERAEVEAVIRSYAGTAYTYKCTEEPLKTYCAKKVCGTREFGARGLKDVNNLTSIPVVENLRLRLSDPRQWVMTIQGRDLLFDSAEILNPAIVKTRVLDQLQLVMPDVKHQAWHRHLKPLLERAPTVAVPKTAGTEGTFLSHVYGYITLSAGKTNSLDDVTSGLAVPHEGRIYFTHVGLRSYLDRQRFKEYNDSDIWQKLEQAGGIATEIEVKGYKASVYTLPGDITMQTDPFDLPQQLKSAF